MTDSEPPRNRHQVHIDHKEMERIKQRLVDGPVDIRHLVVHTRRKRVMRWLRRTLTRSKCGCSCRSCRTYCSACVRMCGRW